MTSGFPLPEGEAKKRSEAALKGFFVPRLGSATPVLYSTWGRRDGDPANPAIFSDFSEMNKRTTAGYHDYRAILEEAGHAPLVVPAGEAFELVWQDSYENNRNTTRSEHSVSFESLYFSRNDGSHPSLQGTYMVACLFYAKLFSHKSIGGLSFHPAALTDSDAAYLQEVADRALRR